MASESTNIATQTKEPTVVAARDSALNLFWLPIWTLTVRELIRFFRQRTRLVGALGQPILFWILFGAGLRGSFKNPSWVPEGMTLTYQEFFFPGVAVLIILFTAIFSTISIIEDRREGFLQSVLAAPIPRLSIVLGKITGGTALALIQACLFLLIGPVLASVGLAPPIGMQVTFGSFLLLGVFLTLLSFALTGLGYLIAWPMNSTQGFHAIMSIFLMPMWLLSGSFFPAGGTRWLDIVTQLNPLTYGVAGLRRIMYPHIEFPVTSSFPSLTTCLIVTFLFCGLCISISVWMTLKQSTLNVR